MRSTTYGRGLVGLSLATIVTLVQRVLPSAPRLPRPRHPIEVSP